MTEGLLPFGGALAASFLLSLALTPAVRYLSVQRGFVANPTSARWHKEPTPLLGGIAIFLSMALVSAPFLLFLWKDRFLSFLLGGAIVFTVGLVDDLKDLKPVTKLLAQIVAACIVVASGILFDLGDHKLLSFLMTVFWIVGVTNAFNLIDNMDGLCAGTACISALVLGAYSLTSFDPVVGILSVTIAGASLGFLRYNFTPASIFMGDCGSMFIGFILAVASILATVEYAGNIVTTFVIPVLVLAVPIFDTTFVSFSRATRGQSIAQGGKDHTSHRLVILGLSEKRTVLMIYTLSLISGGVAFLYAYLNWSIVIIFSVIAVEVAVVFGLFLGEVKVDPGKLPSFLEKHEGAPPAILWGQRLYKRAFVEMVLDLFFVCLAFYSATLLRFEAEVTPERMALVWRALPVLIPVKLFTFYALGLYRSMWRYLGFVDLLHILRAVTTSSVLSVLAVLMLWRFEGYSRTVFVIDWMLFLMFAVGLRLVFRCLRETLVGIRQGTGRRALIVGAGDAGELLVREMVNNPRLDYQPVGFVDDNPGKVGRRMYGLEVMGTRWDLRRIIVEERIDEAIVAIPSAGDDDLAYYFEVCSELGVPCRRMHSLV